MKNENDQTGPRYSLPTAGVGEANDFEEDKQNAAELEITGHCDEPNATNSAAKNIEWMNAMTQVNEEHVEKDCDDIAYLPKTTTRLPRMRLDNPQNTIVTAFRSVRGATNSSSAIQAEARARDGELDQTIKADGKYFDEKEIRNMLVLIFERT